MSSLLRRIVVPSLVLMAAPAAAQTTTPGSLLTTRVAAVGDATVCACDETFLKTSERRALVIVALGRRIPLGSGAGRWDFAWVPEILPLVYSTNTADAQLEVWSCGPRKYCGRSAQDDVWNVTAFGVGVLPLGALIGVRIADRLRARTRISAGVVQLSQPVPLAQGTKFNFVAEGAATIEYRASRRLSMSGGIVLNHISNGGLGRVNLGMDSRMLEIGAVIGR